jgi:ECF sigma factor
MPPEVTQLLIRLRAGERAALDELMPIMYVELRRIARAFMSRQKAGRSWPTAPISSH